MICVIHAHPYPGRSRVNRALATALRTIPDLELRPLYELYPDFDIDVAAEQQALTRARLVVWMHPLFWYSVPALLKHWFDKVLAWGFAYGDGGTALAGKHCLWVPTTGGEADTFAPGGKHALPFASFAAPIEQTARYCGMRWEPPHVVHGESLADAAALAVQADALAARLATFRTRAIAAPAEVAR
jgi:glutathione-regulated potassium-efflux system ancillary protein KefF